MGDLKFDCANQFHEFNTMISRNIEDMNQVNKDHCEQFIEDKLSSYDYDKPKFLKFCANSAQYITKLTEDSRNKLYPFCIYMIYWFYREVLSESIGRYNELVKILFHYVPNSEDCENYVDKIDQDIYEKLKALDDLYENFNKFKIESSQTGAHNCKNGSAFVTLYQKHVDGCNRNYNKDFCSKLIDFKKEYEQHMATLTNCGNIPRYLPSIGSNIATSVSIPVVAMSLISFVSFISYKYTPFGSWIHTKLTGGKKRANKLHLKTEKLQYTSEYQEIPYRMSYQPSRYS